MSEQLFSPQDESKEKLPFSPKTLLLGLWRRWYILVIGIGLSVGGGIAAGLLLGGVTYSSSTTLLYKSASEDPRNAQAELRAQVAMVKVRTNLEEVRQRLQMQISLSGLDGMIDAVVQRGTNLINITVTSANAENTADVANTLREVFINNQRVIKRSLVGIAVRDLEDKLEGVRRDYNIATAALEEFKSEHGIVDLDAEGRGYAGRYSELEKLYEQATIDLESGRLSLGETEFDPGGELTAELQGLSAANVRIQTLLKSMQNDQKLQSKEQAIEEKRRQFEMAQRMFDLGLLPEVQYRDAENAYEEALASMEDSEDVKRRKEALTMALAERLKAIEEARTQLRTKINQLPRLEGEFAELSGTAKFWGGQRRALEETLAKTRREYQSNLSEFTLIREAQVPRQHASSTKKPIALGVAALGSILSFIFILALELLDTRIKSGAEVALKLNLPLLGVFPKLPPELDTFPNRGESELIEPARIIARHVRRSNPKRGVRILVVGAKHGEGVTTAAGNLAACFGRQDERVLLVDGQVREREPDHELKELILDGEGDLKGLGEYLSFEVDETEDVVWASRIPGVECIPRVGEAVIPDLVGSNRMRELLDDVSERFSIVLVDTPPVLPYVDAEVLGQWADAIILVVRSRNERVGTIREAVERLKVVQVPIIGVILNGVDPLYMDKV